MREPLPLREDPTLDEDLRRDLANLRGLPEPSFDFDRGLQSLRASVERSPDSKVARAPASSGVWRVVAGVTVLCVGAVLVARRSALVESPPARPLNAPSSVAAAEAHAPVPVEPPPAPEPAPVTSPAALPDAPQPNTNKAASRGSSSPSSQPTTPIAPSSSARHIHEELAHMRELRERLSSDPAGALAMADEGQRRFSKGVFTQEREVIAIEAMQRLGQTDSAKRRAVRFLEQHPESPFADKVRLHAR